MLRSLRTGFALVLLALGSTALAQDQPLSRIAFGSCADQDRPLPIFDTIAATKPELLLLIGDNIYSDIDHTTGKLVPAAKITPDVIREKYEIMGKLPAYQKLKATCPILATWDDHDYGPNDAGADYPHKEASQALFLDFFGVAKDDPRRTRKGVYHAAIFGPPGKRVQVILLDTRYHRSPLKKAPFNPTLRTAPYLPNTDAEATMLGAEQWAWLEAEFKKPAELRILVSSIQVIADEHPWEKWTNIPKEREKLYALLRDTKAEGVVILSGDRHLAEVSLDTRSVGYPLYDVTSSGLNQGAKAWRAPEVNSHRVAAMPYGDNFGMILIDWTNEPRVTLQIRDEDNDVTCGVKLKLSTLKGTGKVAAGPKLPAGVLSPAEAVRKPNEKVTVQFVVASTGGNTNLHLNSEKDFRSKDNFDVMLPAKGRPAAWEKATGATFAGKTIRVTGTVKVTPQGNGLIEVTEDGQLMIVDAK